MVLRYLRLLFRLVLSFTYIPYFVVFCYGCLPGQQFHNSCRAMIIYLFACVLVLHAVLFATCGFWNQHTPIAWAMDSNAYNLHIDFGSVL